MTDRYDMTDIDACFREIPLLGYWAAIKGTYENMGFTDGLTDDERIDEYNYISEQMHKFISKKHSELMRYRDSLPDMLEVIDDVINRVDESSKVRKTLVYYALRDDWLIQLRNIVWYTIDNLREEDEDAE